MFEFGSMKVGVPEPSSAEVGPIEFRLTQIGVSEVLVGEVRQPQFFEPEIEVPTKGFRPFAKIGNGRDKHGCQAHCLDPTQSPHRFVLQ